MLLTIKEDSTSVEVANKNVRETTKGWTEDRTMKKMMSIPPNEYYHWIDKVGEGCWDDTGFLKFYKNHRPEFCI